MPNKDSEAIFYETLKGVLCDFGPLHGPEAKPPLPGNPKVLNGRERTIKQRQNQSVRCYKEFQDLSCKLQLSLDDKKASKQSNISDNCYDNKIYIDAKTPLRQDSKPLPTNIRKYATEDASTMSSVNSVTNKQWNKAVNIGLPINVQIPNVPAKSDFKLSNIVWRDGIITVPLENTTPVNNEAGKCAPASQAKAAQPVSNDTINKTVQMQQMKSQIVTFLAAKKHEESTSSNPASKILPSEHNFRKELGDNKPLNRAIERQQFCSSPIVVLQDLKNDQRMQRKMKLEKGVSPPSIPTIDASEAQTTAAAGKKPKLCIEKKLPIVVLQDIRNELTLAQKQAVRRSTAKRSHITTKQPFTLITQTNNTKMKSRKRKLSEGLDLNSKNQSSNHKFISLSLSTKLHGKEITPLTLKRCKILCKKI